MARSESARQVRTVGKRTEARTRKKRWNKE